MNLVTKKGDGRIPKYAINKDYHSWRPFPKKVTVTQKGYGVTNKGYSVTQKGDKVSPKKGTTKDTKQCTKDNIDAPKKSAHPDHKKIIEYWMEKYSHKFNIKYSFQAGKDGKLVQRLLKDFEGFETVRQMIDMFFDSEDEWIQTKGGFTIGVFYSQANKIRQRLNEPKNTHKQRNQDFETAWKQIDLSRYSEFHDYELDIFKTEFRRSVVTFNVSRDSMQDYLTRLLNEKLEAFKKEYEVRK